MSSSPLGYLDALFSGIRAFGHELGAARAWLDRAHQTHPPAWRSTLLSAARRSLANAAVHLADTQRRLNELGSPESLLPPLDGLLKSVRAMQHDWDHERNALHAEENELLSTPFGNA